VLDASGLPTRSPSGTGTSTGNAQCNAQLVCMTLRRSFCFKQRCVFAKRCLTQRSAPRWKAKATRISALPP
jgi:hypothetical protein